MQCTYLFTDVTCTIVHEVKVISGDRHNTPGEKALEYAKKLAKKLKKEVVVWSLMGGDNTMPEWPKVK